MSTIISILKALTSMIFAYTHLAYAVLNGKVIVFVAVAPLYAELAYTHALVGTNRLISFLTFKG